ncbi:MAG: hypothetical protein FWC92_11645 [Defluviitaleaceae bacterium]|nr:hypothetical protein [Defluviitaleaceae bacterium]
MKANSFVELSNDEMMLVEGGSVSDLTDAVFWGLGFIARVTVEVVRATADVLTLPARVWLFS